ncbi:MAG: peptide chain release factor N(5)-glutamine methyltransferase [Lentisphaerae bacterium]|jgi:release factor glutamine methyltransferase|nr:peptide chain release factor N(5)-glutamine methyltransferase [Lentisphaerota bacterium]
MKLGEILQASTDYFEKRNLESPRLSAEILAARLLNCKRAEIPLKLDMLLSEKLVNAMRRGVMRVGKGEPVQYVIGQWDFRNLTLKIDRRCLVPRPETEELVQLLLDCKPLRAIESPLILDFGTGSGCIALSVASEFPDARVAGVDVCNDALSLARENAQSLNLNDKVTLFNSVEVDLADIFEGGTLHAIISNPPYIPTAACDNLSPTVRDFEPRHALDGGTDGLDVIRYILDESVMLLASGGVVFFEVSAEDNQASDVSRYMSELGFDKINVLKDSSGAERFVTGFLADGV